MSGNNETGKQHFWFSKGNGEIALAANRKQGKLFPSCCFFPLNGSRTSILGNFVVFKSIFQKKRETVKMADLRRLARKNENLWKQNKSRSRANFGGYFGFPTKLRLAFDNFVGLSEISAQIKIISEKIFSQRSLIYLSCFLIKVAKSWYRDVISKIKFKSAVSGPTLIEGFDMIHTVTITCYKK